MTTCWGVLLEAVSIQKFIFQSNKLKTNLGASHLIQHEIFNKHLKEAVSNVFGKKLDLMWNDWWEKPSEIRIDKEPFEIGYIGGGNALLLFQNKTKAEELIKAWTRILLVHAPGVVTAAVVGTLTLDGFRESLDALFKILRTNKAQYIPQTVLPRHGITAECSQSGLSAEYWWKDKGEYVSSVTGAKLEAAKPARDYFQNLFKGHLKENFCFPNEFEKLGSISGEDSHVAVVHIDGNSMAQRFRKVDSLRTIRNLSASVRRATLTVFDELVNHVVTHYEKIMEDLGFDPQSKDARYWYPMDDEYKIKCLPLAPLVLGGDDVTFVCDGKLGVYFAKFFIEAFEKKQVSDKQKLTACAGVAVIKMKYPFYRGYQLAEALCSNAKKLNKDENDPSKLVSALDFHISMGGIFGSLDQIRKKQYEAPEGYLLYRPYKLLSPDLKDEENLDQMLGLTAELEDFPKNKIKELQGVLSLPKDAREQFVKEANFRGRKLPVMTGRGFHTALFEHGKTIYFDMIELLEFYPKFALKREGSDENL